MLEEGVLLKMLLVLIEATLVRFESLKYLIMLVIQILVWQIAWKGDSNNNSNNNKL